MKHKNKKGIKVLHVFSDTAIDPQQFHLGSTKDIRGRTEYFKSRGIEFDELITPRSYKGIFDKIRTIEMKNYNVVLFEHTLSIGAIRFVRKKYPMIRIMTRAHNAELLHRIDYLKAAGFSSDHFKILKQIMVRSIFDYFYGRWSDYILTITQWEMDNYWSHFVVKDKLKYLPFYLPELHVAEIPKKNNKRLKCVCMMSTSPNSFLIDAAKKFIVAVESLNGNYKDWVFSITGERSKIPLSIPDRINVSGYLDSPYQILSESLAMTILSDYGYGFKTKILEAVLCGTYVIMTKKLYNRVPKDIQQYCIPIDLSLPESFQEALEKCKQPFPVGNLNSKFKANAFSTLDRIFNGLQYL